ncbi:MAG: hypothetical protein R3336_09460, partial [Phycisphaeraceae bacterium]|nr:hypothetical protein [Phycisphaeraceae bacterium]
MADTTINIDDLDRDLSFEPANPTHLKALTPEQIDFYNEQGYLRPFRIFDEEEADAQRAYFDRLLEQVQTHRDGDTYAINGYHTRCRGIYELIHHPKILDLVEDIIGPNIICW